MRFARIQLVSVICEDVLGRVKFLFVVVFEAICSYDFKSPERRISGLGLVSDHLAVFAALAIFPSSVLWNISFGVSTWIERYINHPVLLPISIFDICTYLFPIMKLVGYWRRIDLPLEWKRHFNKFKLQLGVFDPFEEGGQRNWTEFFIFVFHFIFVGDQTRKVWVLRQALVLLIHFAEPVEVLYC